MKTLYRINLIAIIITLLLYVTIIFGMYAQIILGALQLISGLIVIFYLNKLSNKSREKIYIYWILVFLYVIAWNLDWQNFDKYILSIIIPFVIPMLIACYFVYTLRIAKTELT